MGWFLTQTHDDKKLYDDFTIECAGTPYKSALEFTLTDQPGVVNGIWKQFGVTIPITFPNVIVDFQANEKNPAVYDWVVEFQCINNGFFGGIGFYAFNFYSRTNSSENLEAMLNVAKERFPAFLEDGNKLQIVDHTNCWYDKKKWKKLEIDR